MRRSHARAASAGGSAWLERKKSSQKQYAQIKDRVRQAYLSTKLAGYVAGLEKKYAVDWQVLGR